MRLLLWLAVLLLALPAVAQSTPADFIEVTVDNPLPYVGQPVVYTWRWFLATSNAGSTDASTRIDLPDFTGFGQETLPMEANQSQLIGGQQYQVITQQVRLTPRQPGTVILAPIQITTPATPLRPAYTVTSPPLTLTVQALSPGAPPSFRNAIGQFEITAELSSTTTTAGQPVTLRVTLTGVGNVAQALPPLLTLDANWRSYDQLPRFEQVTPQIGRRLFTWTLIPLQAGVQRIPALEWTYFDPLLARYVPLTTAPLPLEVMPGAVAVASLPPSVPAVALAPTLPAFKPLSPVLGTTRPGFSPLFWLAWLVPPLLVIGLWLIARPRVAANVPPLRAGSKPLRAAQIQLKAIATTSTTPQAASAQLQAILLNYFAVRAGRAVTKAELPVLLERLPANVRAQALHCLEQSEAARYAPVTSEDAAVLLRETLGMLYQVDKLWQK